MSRHHSHISTAIKIIENYFGVEPFAIYIKKFFAAQKKYGSRDRKTIAILCYGYFRQGYAFQNKTLEEKILLGLFLTQNSSYELLQSIQPELNSQISFDVKKKVAILNFHPVTIFPLVQELGNGIANNSFYESFLTQPSLFLRLRPGKKEAVIEKLNAAGISFKIASAECLELKNSTGLADIIKINTEAVVQDASSQSVFDYLDNLTLSAKNIKNSAWDCCAASGGKAILLYDKLKENVQLTVSDIRENILADCEKRLRQASVKIYSSFIADLTKNMPPPEVGEFSIIICDVPCTGSGTWGRTPEQLFFFKKNRITYYAEKQKLIAQNALQFLKKDGLFFYITCSVFKKENEEVAKYLKETFHLKLLQMKYIEGYRMKADTMFVAVFTK